MFICSLFSTARRTNQEASPQLSGLLARRLGCRGTRFARTVLALFSPSPLRFRLPIKAESGFVLLLVFYPPRPSGTPPIFLVGTQGERRLTLVIRYYLTPPSCGHLPYILHCKTPRHATGRGRGGGEYPIKFRRDKTVQSDTFNPLPLLIADEIGGVPAGRGG